MKPLILGSSSPARKKLLKRLNYPFTTYSPDINETLKPNETIDQAVARLSHNKTDHVRQQHSGPAVIIGCDQLISLGQTILGKPITHKKAIEQLTQCSGNIITSHTGLTVLDTVNNHIQSSVITYQVKFKKLSPNTIDQYLKRDQPYQCAGSIRAESLGIALFEWMRGDDPTALIGLPLIQLSECLFNANINVISATD